MFNSIHSEIYHPKTLRMTRVCTTKGVTVLFSIDLWSPVALLKDVVFVKTLSTKLIEILRALMLIAWRKRTKRNGQCSSINGPLEQSEASFPQLLRLV